jgi:hypothetical protein
MKLTTLQIKNFLGARNVEVDLTTPITLFSGKNGSGKSSIQEAVRLALTGEPSRVSLKKDYKELVTEGAKSGIVSVEFDGGGVAAIALPSGKRQEGGSLSDVLPFVLDARYFARLGHSGRRVLLFDVMGIKRGGSHIGGRLSAKGCEAKKVELIAPYLRAGFDTACKEAENRAREEKAAWRTLTGETWGEKKAAAWRAEKPEAASVSSASIDSAAKRVQDADEQIAEINQKLGALKSVRRNHEETLQRLADLREKGARYARIAVKLAHDEDELKTWEETVEKTRRAAQGGRKAGLVHDLACALRDSLTFAMPFDEMDEHQLKMLTAANIALDAYQAEHGPIAESDAAPDPEAAARLPEHEKALKLLQSSVANDRRDLAEANAAAQAIKEAESAIGTPPASGEIEALEQRLIEMNAEYRMATDELSRLRDLEKQAKGAEETTAKARAAHESVLAWLTIAAALAPDGIPGELLAEALGPINEHLSASSEIWGPVVIHPDMRLTYGGRDYALLSESEKWRTDALIAKAISHLSGVKLLVLDRFDVLDLAGRADLIYWLETAVDKGEIDTALIFGTLKSLPANLPETVSAHWIEHGIVGQMREAA